MQQHPQRSHTTGYAHVRSQTHVRTLSNMTAFLMNVYLDTALSEREGPDFPSTS